MSEINDAIEQLEFMFYHDYDTEPEEVCKASYPLLDLCKALAKQNAIQAEQLDRLADAVPSAFAHTIHIEDLEKE